MSIFFLLSGWLQRAGITVLGRSASPLACSTPPRRPHVLTLWAAPLHCAVTAALVQLAAAAGSGHCEGHPCRRDGIDECCLPRPCNSTNDGGKRGSKSAARERTSWKRCSQVTSGFAGLFGLSLLFSLLMLVLHINPLDKQVRNLALGKTHSAELSSEALCSASSSQDGVPHTGHSSSPLPGMLFA